MILALLAIASIAAQPPGRGGRGGVDSAGVARIRERYTKTEVRIAMRDGTRLFTAVYEPRDTTRTYPFMMTRTPYGVAPYGADQYPARLGPTPRFSRTGPEVRNPPPSPGQYTDAALADWGLGAEDVARLKSAGAIA